MIFLPQWKWGHWKPGGIKDQNLECPVQGWAGWNLLSFSSLTWMNNFYPRKRKNDIIMGIIAGCKIEGLSKWWCDKRKKYIGLTFSHLAILDVSLAPLIFEEGIQDIVFLINLKFLVSSLKIVGSIYSFILVKVYYLCCIFWS